MKVKFAKVLLQLYVFLIMVSVYSLDAWSLNCRDVSSGDENSLLSSPIEPSHAQITAFQSGRKDFMKETRFHADPALDESIKAFVSHHGIVESLKVLKALSSKKSADYYFVGNGMRPYFEIISSIVRGTALQSRFHFLEISRDLVNNPIYRAQLKEYLIRKGIAPDRSQNFVLVDSISWLSASVHSLVRLRFIVEESLSEQGLANPSARVSLLAIPESALNVNESWALSGLRHDLSPIMAKAAYNLPRWNGLHALDPHGKFTTFDPVTQPSDPARQAALRVVRLNYLNVYNHLLTTATEMRDQPDVIELLKQFE